MNAGLLNVIISLVSGNVSGAVSRSTSMGPMWNTVLVPSEGSAVASPDLSNADGFPPVRRRSRVEPAVGPKLVDI
jgi:hypothetical protein